jgi:hypothetical protein
VDRLARIGDIEQTKNTLPGIEAFSPKSKNGGI